MELLKGLVATIGVTVVLNLALLWSNNLVFVLARKPAAWIFIAGIIGLGSIPVCHALGFSHSVAFWGAAFALVLRIPPKHAFSSDTEFKETVDEIYVSMGIHPGRLKYGLGLTAFGLGCAAGYVMTYGEVVDIGARGI